MGQLAPGLREQPLAELGPRLGPLHRMREERSRLAEREDVRGALLALCEVLLERGVLVVVERVERVAGRKLVEALRLHQPGSLANLAAAGDQSTENPGLRPTARRNHRMAAASLPRQRSIIPRWKKNDASWVPRRRARFE